MMRCVALLALVAGASALEAIDIQQKTSELLQKKLASFEKKDLNEAEVYEEYVEVRKEAKKAADALEYAREFGPAPVDNEEVLEKEEDAQDEKVEVALKEKKQEEKVEEKPVEKVKETEEDQEDSEDKGEIKEVVEIDQKLIAKKDKMLPKERNLLLKRRSQIKDRQQRHMEDREKFSSPYRAATKKEFKQVDVIDEGTGDYGRFSAKILGATEQASLIQQDSEPLHVVPKVTLSLEDTMAKRDKELQQLALDKVEAKKKGLKLYEKAKKLCNNDYYCLGRVQKKFDLNTFETVALKKITEARTPAK